MSRRKDLYQRRADLTKEAQGILDKAAVDKSGELTAEQETRFEAIKVEQAATAKAIEREEWLLEQAKVAGDPTAAADAKDVAEFRDGAKITSEEKGRFRSFGEQLQAIAMAANPRGGAIDPRLVPSAGPTGGSANVGSDGGFLIESQFMPGIMEHAAEVGVLWPRTHNVPIGEGKDRLEWMQMDDYDQSTGLSSGGVQVYFRAEAETVPPTKPKMTEAELKLQDLMGITYMTGRLLEDAPAMEAIYERAFGRAFARKLDRVILNGTGAGQPLGIMNSPALVTVAKETGQDADSLVAENFMKMWSHMPPELRGGAIWLTSLEADTQLPGMQIGTGASGQLVYMPAGGMSTAPYGTIYGRPVIPYGGLKKLGDLGDVLLVNLDEYLTISKGGLRKASSIHVRFIYDETCFRFMMRVNGAPKWSKPITPENASSGFKQSPFITLQAR